MEPIMPDLVLNLGHLAPSVRKGAVDCIRAYLNNTKNSNNIVRGLVFDGLENKTPPSIVVGITLALPFFLTNVTDDTISYVVKTLFDKMIQITYQEVALRSLVQIKDIIGDDAFKRQLSNAKNKRDFDILCEVYNAYGKNNESESNKIYWSDLNQNVVEESRWRSNNNYQVIVREHEGEIIEDKVILETEIQLNSGPAITMQIHEESRQVISDSEQDDNARNASGLVKILTDESEEDYEPRRTPRRVRFGGEIVKLRTPDSDSNHTSDLDNTEQTITINSSGDQPIIQINYNNRDPTATRHRSQIPVLNTKTSLSEPNSPMRKLTRKTVYNSSPTLNTKIQSKIPIKKVSENTTTIQIKFTDFTKNEVVHERNKVKHTEKTKLPKPKLSRHETCIAESSRSQDTSPKPIHKEIEIFHNLSRSPERTSPAPQDLVENHTGSVQTSLSKSNNVIANKKATTNGARQIKQKIAKPKQVVHNSRTRLALPVQNKTPKQPLVSKQNLPVLSKQKQPSTTSNSTSPKIVQPLPTISDKGPTKKDNETVASRKESSEPQKLPTPNKERQSSTADKVLLNRQENQQSQRKIRTADQLNKTAVLPAINGTYDSFQVCSSTYNDTSDYLESTIPTNDNGECLTCSSSGSDSFVMETNSNEPGKMSATVFNRLNCKDDWRTRLRELEHLRQLLKEEVNNILEEKSSTLLHFLFSCEHDDRLQLVSEEVLSILFSKINVQILEKNLHQAIKNLCQMGSPAGVRLSILIIKRIGAQKFLEYLFKGKAFVAKSSKIREGALQILMSITRVCPSTDINVPIATEVVTPLLYDRKRRIRRAVLETIATLAHISTPTEVLAIIVNNLDDKTEKDHLISVVRTRLSRKQLPMVGQNGNVSYSTPTEGSELQWISSGSSSNNSTHSLPERALIDVEHQRYKTHIDNIKNNNTAQQQNFSGTDQQRITPFQENKEIKDNDTDESDWSRNSDEDEANGKALQIWAVDPWTLSTPVTLSSANGTLRPLYLVQNEQLQSSSNSTVSSQSYANENNVLKQRGRSYSPPKRDVGTNKQNVESARFISSVNNSSASFDNIRTVGIQFSSNSASSSNSGGSSNAAAWNRTFKSSIPVPVSSDSKIRFKTRHLDVNKGPLSIPTRIYRTKSPSPLCTPEKISTPQRSILVRQPFSSESESCEFYTPPAEPLLASPYKQPVEEIILESPRPSENSIQVDSPRYHNENFTVLDDNFHEVLEANTPYTPNNSHKHSEDEQEAESEDKESAIELNHSFEEKSFHNEYHSDEPSECHSSSEVDTCIDLEDTSKAVTVCSSLDNLDTYNTPRSFVLKSKSEINLQCANEASRKTISSAPALNELLTQARYETLDDSLISASTVLPGATSEILLHREVQTPLMKTPRSKSLCRRSSIRVSKREVTPFPITLGPFAKPREGFNETLELLDSNEWELTVKGLQGIVRLSRHHPDIVENQIHGVCVAVGKQVKNLRSQVSRAACLASSEMFATHKKALEMHLEELAVPLLHRTADTNKFLRSDANAALDSMSLNIAIPRVVAVIASKGACHQNAIVRCTAARLLSSLTNRLGSEKIFQLPKDTRDKILFSGANMLMEGNLDTRKHAKIMFGNLANHNQFYRAISEAVPVTTIRHIQKTLRNLQ